MSTNNTSKPIHLKQLREVCVLGVTSAFFKCKRAEAEEMAIETLATWFRAGQCSAGQCSAVQCSAGQ